jgi:molybdopterin-guanine dinucleotide biosynthesis protein A
LGAYPEAMFTTPLKIGGIVLCGGRSSRMGQPKALLPVGSEVMLQRVVRTLSQVVSPIVVVAAAGQELPPVEARTARDPVEYRGPLAGLAVGLAELRDQVDAVYLTACDVPLLTPAFVAAMIAQLGDFQIAVPRDGQFHHPLAAVYRTSVLPTVETLLATDQLRPVFLFERCPTREVLCEELRAVDPDLDSLANTNTPEEYARVLVRVRVQDRPLPPYTHIPGVTPHPISDPAGHMHGAAEHVDSIAGPLTASEPYLWGRRLFQSSYYWEAHEAWEGLWHALGRSGPRADLVKGLIKLAAAGVKLREYNRDGLQRHLARAEELTTQARAGLLDSEEAAFAERVVIYTRLLRMRELPFPLDQTGRPQVVFPQLP